MGNNLSPYVINRNGSSTERVEVEPIFLDAEEESVIDLEPYWRAIRKRARVIVAIVATSVSLTSLYAFTAVPIYTAETILMIRPHSPEIFQPKDLVLNESSQPEPDFFATQCALLGSRVLALNVVRQLKLADNPAFNSKTTSVLPGVHEIKSFLFAAIIGSWHLLFGTAHANRAPAGSGDSSEKPSAEQLGLAQHYLGALEIEPVHDTSLIRLTYSSPSPQLAAEIANAHAQAFIHQGIKLKSQSNVEAEHFLQNKLVELRTGLEQSERKLNDYRRAKGIIPGLISLDGKETVVVDRLSDLSKDLTAAQVARIGLEAQVDTIRRGHFETLPSVMDNQTIQSLQQQLDALTSQGAGLSQEFTARYPRVAQMNAKIAQTRARLHQQIEHEVRTIEGAYAAATHKEQKLQTEMDEQRSVALKLNDAAVRYAILQRDVDTNRQLYNSVLQRMKDVGLAAEAQTSNASVVDTAIAPLVPSSPHKLQDLLLSLVLSLMGGAGLALALEFFDNSLKAADDVETTLHLPNLSSIPDFSTPEPAGYLPRHSAPPAIESAASAGKEIYDARSFDSLVGESYRHLRTALMLSRAESPPQVSLVTSALRGEGKTVTAINTAIMLAQFEGRVLLIDADLRRARCHRLLGMERGAGLTEVLTGSQSVFDAIRATCVDRLHLLSAGLMAPNPTELLASEKMRALLGELRGHYQYIVIDSPPVIPVTDAVVLSTMVDGVMVVIGAGRTPKKQVKLACGKLRHARAKIFGTVLNKVHLHPFEYNSYYDYTSFREVPDDAAVN